MIKHAVLTHVTITLCKVYAKKGSRLRDSISLCKSAVSKRIALSFSPIPLRNNFILNFLVIPNVVLFITFFVCNFLFVLRVLLNFSELITPVVFKRMILWEDFGIYKFLVVFLSRQFFMLNFFLKVKINPFLHISWKFPSTFFCVFVVKIIFLFFCRKMLCPRIDNLTIFFKRIKIFLFLTW